MQGGIDKLVVRLDRKFQDGTGVMGHNGMEIIIDTSFAPNEHKTIYGEVVALPTGLSERTYTEVSGRKVPYSDINAEDIKLGDRVYFSYLFNDESYFLGDGCYCIDLREIFCSVRHHFSFDIGRFNHSMGESALSAIDRFRALYHRVGFISAKKQLFRDNDCVEELNPTITMIGSHILVERLWPESVTINESGTPEMKTKSGLILLSEVAQTEVMVADDPDDINDFEQNKSARMKYEIKPIPGKGKVVQMGKPLKGFNRLCLEGDVVYFNKRYGFLNTIEGKPLYVMLQHNLDAVERG